MKIAICFFGKIGYSHGRESYGDKLDINITYNHLRKHVLEKYDDTDIFIHSWDIEDEEKLISVFKPISIKCEKQKSFGINIDDLSINEQNDERNIGKNFRAISQTYSLISSFDLAIENEEKNNFKYDYIVGLRLDTLFLKDLKIEYLEKESINLQRKVSINSKPINWLNEAQGYIHSGFIIILNSNLLRNTEYKQIYNFDYNNKNNIYYSRKIINTFSMLNPILLNNKIREGIPPNTTYITRRIYYEYELVFENNKINKCVCISKKQIKLNWEKYNNYYKL